MVADVAGYSRLMERAEEATFRRLRQLTRSVVQPALERRQGHLVKHTGDGFVATFASVVAAAECALEIQAATRAANAGESPSDAIHFRIGLNFAEVIVDAGDVFGDGVNVAARLQTFAEPGGLMVSDAVAEAIAGRVDAIVASVGDFYPKNLTRRVRAFSVRRADTGTPEAGFSSAHDALPSIAVLPFHHTGESPDDAYLTEGVIEGIIHTLSGLDGLVVISQGSTHTYAGRLADVRAVGRELGVHYVLSGSVRRAGERLRITTELSDARTGEVASVDRYDGAFGDIFDLQDSISAHAVSVIAPHVRDWELRRARRKPTESLTAYDLMLRSVDLMLRLDPAEFDRARGLLQQAIADDPGFAPGWAYAAYWHLLRIGQGWSTDVAADQAEARRCAAAALQRDEGYALALAILGHMTAFLDHDFDAAAALLDRALEAGPNVALAWSFASATSGYLGDGPAALMRAERAIRLSPRDPFAFRHETMLAQAHYVSGNFAEAITWGEAAARHNRRFTSNLRILVGALVAEGQLARAREVAALHLAAEPGFSIAAWARRTPLRGELLEALRRRLAEAGLPD